MLKRLHRGIGLLLSTLIFLISVSGSLLLLKPEYLKFTIPESREALRTELLVPAIKKIMRSYPDDEVSFVQLNAYDLSLHKVYLGDHSYAWHAQTGQALQRWRANQRFEDWLLDLHHRFLLGNTIGLNMAGFAGLFLIPLMLLGVVLWWPRRRFFKTGFIPRHARQGAVMRSHANLGVAVLIPAVLLSLTGVILVYYSESRWLLVNGFSSTPPPPVVRQVPYSATSLSQQLARIELEFPDSTIRWMSFDTKKETTTVGLQQVNAWDPTGKTSVQFGPDEMVIKDAKSQLNRVRLIDFAYALHTGRLGLWYRLLLILFGMSLAAVSAFALYSYGLGRREKRRPS